MAKCRHKGRKTIWRKLEIDISAPSAAAGDDCFDTRDNNKETSRNTITTCNEEMSYEENDGLYAERRREHMAVCLEHYVVIFGGIDFSSKALPCRVIWLYNLYTEIIIIIIIIIIILLLSPCTIIIIIIIIIIPLQGDKVSMLTHIYPHKPWRNIEVTICKITRLTAHFVWPDV